jgi:nitronate monooxygenase
MSIPAPLLKNLRLPVIAAPMFLVSGPELVLAACEEGVIGTFPALNCRTSEAYEQWLIDINERRSETAAAYGVNLIVHPSNTRLMEDGLITAKHKVPLVITSLGAVKEIVDSVHNYGGVVFHDVINARHAKKAAEAGVDGLILVAAGAGGHSGTWSPFALINEVRQFFDGTIILSGAQSTGRDLAAAIMMGADFGYMGTRFIATQEAMADQAYKDMITESSAKDITYTAAVSGIPANFLTPSLMANGLDPKVLAEAKPHAMKDMSEEAKAWKTVWSAGHGVGSIKDNPKTAELIDSLKKDFAKANESFHNHPVVSGLVGS